MEDNLSIILKNSNDLLHTIKKPTVQIYELSIFHSKTILISIKNNAQEFFIQFDQSLYFYGNLSKWNNSNLILSSKKESLNDFFNIRNNRQIMSDVFKLEDLTNGYYIKSREFSLHNKITHLKNENKISHYLGDIDKTKIIKTGKKILSKWKSIKVQVWNSNLNIITIRVEPNIIIDYLNNENNLKKGNIHIVCHEPSFYCGSFTWYMETYFDLKYEDEKFTIKDLASGYYVKCSNIEFRENCEPVY